MFCFHENGVKISKASVPCVVSVIVQSPSVIRGHCGRSLTTMCKAIMCTSACTRKHARIRLNARASGQPYFPRLGLGQPKNLILRILWTHTQTRTHTHTQTHAHARTDTRAHIHVHMSIPIHIPIYPCTYTYTRAHKYICTYAIHDTGRRPLPTLTQRISFDCSEFPLTPHLSFSSE